MGDVRPRVLVVGGGFVGFGALRWWERRLPAGVADLVLVSPTDYLLYTPLLPDVAAGSLEARHVAVSLRESLPRTRRVLGHVRAVDLGARTATVELAGGPGEPGEQIVERWDRLVLATGSVTRHFDIPGVAEHAHGVKTLTEAVFLRDHLLAQLDIADALPVGAAGDEERRERLTVVAVGAGYTGTEVVTQLQASLATVAARWDRIDSGMLRWVLVDLGKAVLPELGPQLAARAAEVLRKRRIELRLGVTVRSATDRAITLTDGAVVPARTLIWGAGVTASPLIATLGLPLRKGRLTVDPELRVPGAEHVWAAGDAAAVPDLVKRRTDGERPMTPPTAQHAQRQGVALARNVAASLGIGRARPYRHRDLGMVADFGGRDAVARPLGLSLTGLPAKAVTRGYHLYSLPTAANRVRVAVDWLLAAALPAPAVQLSVIRPGDALVAAAEQTDIYPTRSSGDHGH